MENATHRGRLAPFLELVKYANNQHPNASTLWVKHSPGSFRALMGKRGRCFLFRPLDVLLRVHFAEPSYLRSNSAKILRYDIAWSVSHVTNTMGAFLSKIWVFPHPRGLSNNPRVAFWGFKRRLLARHFVFLTLRNATSSIRYTAGMARYPFFAFCQDR